MLELAQHSRMFPDKEKSAPNRGAYLGGACSFGQWAFDVREPAAWRAFPSSRRALASLPS